MLALLIACVLAAAVTWYAVAAGRARLEALAKPLTIALLIAWLAGTARARFALPDALFIGGLSAALVGDVLLLRPRRRLAAGMAAFVITQLAYAVAIGTRGCPPLLPGALIGGGVAAIAVAGFALLSRRARWHRRRWLRPATIVYAGVLALMLWSALTAPLRPDWPAAAAWCVAVGGLLFACSDAALGWVEFVRPSRRKLVLVMVTYHLAQLSLVWGFAQRP